MVSCLSVRIGERDRNQFLHGGREMFGGVVGEQLLGRAHMVVPQKRNHRGGRVGRERALNRGSRGGLIRRPGVDESRCEDD